MAHSGRHDKQATLRQSLLSAGILLAVTFALGACRFGGNETVSLPATPQLFGSLPWGMVNVTYTKGFTAPNTDSGVVAVLRGGDVVSIQKRSQQQERIGTAVDYWYLVRMDEQEFWIFGNLLSFYGLEMQARTAAGIVQEKLFRDVEAGGQITVSTQTEKNASATKNQ